MRKIGEEMAGYERLWVVIIEVVRALCTVMYESKFVSREWLL